jgi:hypothetical protein
VSTRPLGAVHVRRAFAPGGAFLTVSCVLLKGVPRLTHGEPPEGVGGGAGGAVGWLPGVGAGEGAGAGVGAGGELVGVAGGWYGVGVGGGGGGGGGGGAVGGGGCGVGAGIAVGRGVDQTAKARPDGMARATTSRAGQSLISEGSYRRDRARSDRRAARGLGSPSASRSRRPPC